MEVEDEVFGAREVWGQGEVESNAFERVVCVLRADGISWGF